MKKEFLLLILTGIFIMTIPVVHAQSQELNFSIKLDKSSYKIDEPVKCTFMLKNNSAQDMVVNNRFLVNIPGGPLEISLELIGPDMKPAIFQNLINASWQSGKYMVLNAGNTVSKIYDLSSAYNLLPAGDWTILAYYENKQDPPESANLSSSWKGQLISNKIKFTIH